jgi:hypothetical protein
MVFAGISEGFMVALPWIRLRGSESIYLVQRRFYATEPHAICMGVWVILPLRGALFFGAVTNRSLTDIVISKK